MNKCCKETLEEVRKIIDNLNSEEIINSYPKHKKSSRLNIIKSVIIQKINKLEEQNKQ